MPSYKKIEHYRTYMRHYASMLRDCSDSDKYIIELIYKEKLSPIDKALRKWIEQCPPDE